MKQKCLLLLAFCFTLFTLNGQQLLETLDTYNKNFPHENIHVHFDKALYHGGETIWFKAYIRSGTSPTFFSTNFYAELLDSNGVVKERKRYPVLQGTAAGNFDLPVSLNHTYYIFRAYTGWTTNFDSSFVFYKTIPLITSGKLPPPPDRVDLRFFPEGGDLVKGLETVVAFKAMASNGSPVPVSGVIKTTDGKTITTFQSMHDGMGSFLLHPLSDSLFAEWQDGQGKLQRILLPLVKPSGVALQMKQEQKYISYILKQSASARSSHKKLHLVAQMHQQVIYWAMVDLEDSAVTSGIIPTDTVPTGIMMVTLFDSSWKPISERIIFIDKKDYAFPASLNIVTKNLQKRGKNVIEIEVPDTIETNLSVAITDAGLPPDGESIVTRLLLTSELHGYVHNPAYYFSGADSAAAHLDLVMLTNGWRRYKWDDLAQGKLPVAGETDQKYLDLRGQVKDLLSTEIGNNTQLNVFLVEDDTSRYFLTIPVTRNGQFSKPGLILFDTLTVWYDFNDKKKFRKKGSVDFYIDKHKTPKRLGTGPGFLPLVGLPEEGYRRGSYLATKFYEVLPEVEKRSRVLQEVFVHSQVRSREKQMEKKYVSGLFAGGNARTFNLLDDHTVVSSLNVLEYLRGRVAGLMIMGGGTDYRVMRRNSQTLLYLDEVPADAYTLTSVSLSDIAYIKVFDPPFFLGPGGGPGGAIAVYTKRGGDPYNDMPAGIQSGQVMGYHTVKEFYSPDYSRSSSLHRVEDIRSTLYWNAHLHKEKHQNRLKIEFYNNDISSGLRVILEGMNMNGQVIRLEKIME